MFLGRSLRFLQRIQGVALSPGSKVFERIIFANLKLHPRKSHLAVEKVCNGWTS
jgi:hypothetical protein